MLADVTTSLQPLRSGDWCPVCSRQLAGHEATCWLLDCSTLVLLYSTSSLSGSG
jgi:hypothetical protein